MKIDNNICRKARLAKDARFDGLFFTAVKTTGIFCRSICPVAPPKEQNVEYFASSLLASKAGYRPCLRCRPDSAPGSFAWKGTDTTLERATKILEDADDISMQSLAQRLGISDRYLRKLFDEKLGVSPKQYQLHQRLMFAKQLLHQSQLSMLDIAYSSGFGSVRRFNEAFQQYWQLTPTQVRKAEKSKAEPWIRLTLSYRPPYDIDSLLNFYQNRKMEGIEWVDVDKGLYGRSFALGNAVGWFEAKFQPHAHQVLLTLAISDYGELQRVVCHIKRVLDLDLDIEVIEQSMLDAGFAKDKLSGIRIPGCWSLFEAGIKAILGQQVSVKAATNLTAILIENLGQKFLLAGKEQRLFPSPAAIADSELLFLKMPQSRRNTLRALAQHVVENPDGVDAGQWLPLKGIGPWTVDYAKMRGQSDPDIWLDKDLGIKKGLALFALDADAAAPWRSYLTFNLWHQLY